MMQAGHPSVLDTKVVKHIEYVEDYHYYYGDGAYEVYLPETLMRT